MTGSGTLGDPYIIYDVNDLQAIENHLAAYYELANDIDASATSGWNDGAGFLPIGENNPYFTGNFDGKGYSITNLYINRPDWMDVALIAVTAGNVVIQNVNLVNVNITGGWAVGGIVSYVIGISLEVRNCSVSGSMVTKNIGEAGGIIGCMYTGEGLIDHCHVSGTVSGSNFYSSIGGIVGENCRPLTISNSYTTCNVEGKDYVGGIVGYSGYNANLTMEKCFTTGNITGSNWGAGGLIGDFSVAGSIKNCYATGHITGNQAVGGAFGAFYNGTIEFVYSAGLVTGNSYVGGLHGYDSGSEEVNPCFWDKETSGQLTSVTGTGKTTVQMQTKSTFTDAGWDFNTIWAMCVAGVAGYPCLLGVTPDCASCIAHRHHPTIPTEPNRGKVLSEMGSL